MNSATLKSNPGAQPIGKPNSCRQCRERMRAWALMWRHEDAVFRPLALANALLWRSGRCFH